MKYLIFQIILQRKISVNRLVIILAFSIGTFAFAIEGIDPPRKAVELKIEMQNDKKSLPSDFAKLFEAPFQYFLHRDTTSSFLSLSAFGGMNSLGAQGNFSSSKLNICAIGSKDTITALHYSARTFGTFRTAPLHQFPLSFAFSGMYERRNFLGWYPGCYGANVFGKFLIPAKKGLLSLKFSLSAYERKNYPFLQEINKVQEIVSGEYREATGMLGMRGYGFLSERFGAFAGAGYAVARRGEELLPQSGHLLSVGSFYEKIPIVAKLGVSAVKIKDDKSINFRPSVETRWVYFPVSAICSYGIGIDVHRANAYSVDATIDPSKLRTALVETLGVKIAYTGGKYSITVGGIYGKTSALPYILQDTSSWFSVETSSGTLARAWCEFAASETLFNLPMHNLLSAKIDRSKLDGGYYAPFVPNADVIDTFKVDLRKWLSLWGSMRYLGAFYREEKFSKWTASRYYSSCGAELKWHALRLALSVSNITGKLIYEQPYFPHTKREVRLYLGLQNTIAKKQ